MILLQVNFLRRFVYVQIQLEFFSTSNNISNTISILLFIDAFFSGKNEGNMDENLFHNFHI